MQTAQDLAGRTALITGVSGAIGARIAQAFGAHGATVVGTYRGREAEAEAALAGIPAERRELLQAELAAPEGARELWRRAAEGRDIDTLVVNAAAMTTTPLSGDEHEAWDTGWEHAFRVNVHGATTLMREAALAFAERGSGSIIAISSWAAEQGSRLPDAGAYAATKAALRNFAQTLARANARTGVRVYVIAPGVVDGGMGTSGQSQEQIRATAEGLAMGQHVDPQEIADLAAFLATDRCPSLTGGTIDLNGASYIR